MAKLGRQELVELVRKVMAPPVDASSAQIDQWVKTLESNVADPMVSDYIFWPDRDMTAEQVVDRALAYVRPQVEHGELEILLEEFIRINTPGRPGGYTRRQAEQMRHEELYPLLAGLLCTEPNALAQWAIDNGKTAADIVKLHREGKLRGGLLRWLRWW